MASGPALVHGDLVFPIHRLVSTVGRRNLADNIVPAVDLTLLDRDRVVSRRHAEIEWRDGALRLIDVEARNGVFVNGERMAPGSARPLNERDAISFGGVALTFVGGAAWPDGLVAEWNEAGSFEEAHDVTVAAGATMRGQLSESVARGELVLHYQPKVHLASGALEAVECLVRWKHPARGMLYPDAFLSLAETTGYITTITGWVLAAALAQCATWRGSRLDIATAVNISTRDLEDPRLVERVQRALADAGVAPGKLIIEITETGVMADTARAIEHLAALKATGVRISIDDFGIGQSSLAYLRQLPADELKIDKSFSMSLDAHSRAILRSAVDMGHALGMRVIAEGVETADAVDVLNDLGCDVGQGYYFGRPQAADVFFTSPLARAAIASPTAG
ncbi:MAG: EAL domain-containing protein [Kofleriaceae bacterium]|nr:MAG: EAL domain-containing protein [Kofleriaceae bacterium]MBZ0230954.1 EAL domain-containing protein [Kofleriaceae bacterium]